MAPNNYLTYEVKSRKIFGRDRWIATLRLANRCSFDEIAKEVEARTSCQSGEVEGFITALVYEVYKWLEMGENVEIEGLGTFYPKMTTKVVDNVEEATIKNCISSITVGFRPHTKLKNAIKNAGLKEYTKAKLKSNDKEE